MRGSLRDSDWSRGVAVVSCEHWHAAERSDLTHIAKLSLLYYSSSLLFL